MSFEEILLVETLLCYSLLEVPSGDCFLLNMLSNEFPGRLVGAFLASTKLILLIFFEGYLPAFARV